MKIPKQVSLKHFTVILVATVLLMSFTFYVIAQTPTETFWITGGVYPSEATHVIFKEGSNFFCKTDNGQVLFSGANATTLVQNVINALPASDGGHIHFKPLEAEVGNIAITGHNVTISGSGWGSVLYPPTNATHVFSVSGDHFQIFNIRLTGNSVTGAHGIVLESGSEEAEIHHNYINAFEQSAIESKSGSHVSFIHNNWLSSNGVSATSASLLLSSLSDSTIENNQIGGGTYTIWMSGGGIILNNNKIFGAVDYHIYLDSPRWIIIDGNIIGGGTPYPQYDNIFLTGFTSYQKSGVITNNIFYRGGSPWGRDGIRLAGSTCHNYTISGNNFYDIAGVGVYEYHASVDFNVITSNTFVNCSVPYILTGSHTIASNNRLDVSNIGTSVLSSGATTTQVTVGYLDINSKIFLTIQNGTANMATGEYLKVNAIGVYPANTFNVSCGDGGTASTDIHFYYKVEN